MLKTVLVNEKDGHSTEIAHTPHGHLLMTTTPYMEYAHFKSSTRTTAGTTVVVQPISGEAIAITDIVVSGEKKAGTLTVQFTDGTETVNIMVVPLTDAPANFGVSFSGRWAGWRDARISMVTDAVANITVAIGYVKITSEHTLSYAEWNAAR
jgi:hypothetical protein